MVMDPPHGAVPSFLRSPEAQITMMQHRIDRLALLNEKQAAEQLEPKEMEELRERNER